MAAPTEVTQYTSAGASGHTSPVAVGTFTWGAEQSDAEDMIFIHCGFVPRLVIWCNETNGAAGTNAVMWWDSMPNITCFLIDDGTYTNIEGIMGWDSSKTTAWGGQGVVPIDEYYLREGVAYQSGTFVQDKIIGFKVLGSLEGGLITGTDGDTLHYAAFG